MDPTLNSILNNAQIKQPEPSLGKKPEVEPQGAAEAGNKTVKKQKRQIIRPNVGVVDVPKISSTPMSDTITLKKQENPHTVYKMTPKSKKNFNFQSKLSLIVGGCGCAALISGIVKKIKG